MGKKGGRDRYEGVPLRAWGSRLGRIEEEWFENGDDALTLRETAVVAGFVQY